ncbi:MAG: ATP-binding protein [Planctomycetota bacterium]
MNQPPAIDISLRSKPIYLAGTRELIVGIAKRLGFSDQLAAQIALASDEALANVINHGYGRREDGIIHVLLWPEAEPGVKGLRLVIEDEGVQIDPDKICGRDLDDVKPGGLGVHIMREVMDIVRYERRDQAGMRLTMIKRLPAPEQKEAHEARSA